MNKKSKILSTTINKSTSSLMDDFNSSIDIDKRLIEEDIAVTSAHVKALVKLKVISKKDVSMASADDVKAQTGFTIGGVSPVGHINDLNIIIDRTLERFQIVYAAAGHPNSIFKIDISKLKDLTKGRVEDITEWDSLL